MNRGVTINFFAFLKEEEEDLEIMLLDPLFS